MIYPVINYFCLCDNCGKDYETTIIQDGYPLTITYPDEAGIFQDIEGSDWLIEDDKHYCPDCFLGFDEDDNVVLKEIEK